MTLLAAARTVRGGLLRVADQTGINYRIAHSKWRQRRLLILCYHGVSIDDEHEWSDLYVSPALLERRLKLLRQLGASILPLDSALDALSEGELPPCSVSITFDDGSSDFVSRALPILRAADAPVTLYLTTYYCGRGQAVFDTITSYLLWKARGRTIVVPGLGQSFTVPATIADAKFQEMHLALRRYAADSELDTGQKDALVRRLATVVGEDYDEILERRLLQLMTPDELKRLDPGSVNIQLHTHRHRAPLVKDEFMREISDNASAIRKYVGAQKELTQFCYPSGEYATVHGEWLRGAGVRWATTCNPGLVTRSTDPMLLPRLIDFEHRPDASFLAWVSGLNTFTHSTAADR